MKTAVLSLTVVLLLIAVPTLVAEEPPENSIWLTPGKLTRAGLHFKTGIPTMADQGKYQGGLPAEVLTLEWNSLPGIAKDSVRADEVRDVPVSANFMVLERKASANTGVGFGQPFLATGLIVIAAVTSENEIRSVSIQSDPRGFFTEDIAHQKPRIDLVKPKVRFDVEVPADPGVLKLVFLVPVADKEHGVVLNKMAEFKLPAPKKP